jgi:hypothetical protein
MGEVDAGPAAPAKPMPDLTALEVDPAKGERFFKAVLVHSKQGTTYRMVAKAMADGRLDLVHFVCDLSADGTMNGKRRIRRIESQRQERWDTEVATIQKEITDKGEEVQKVWAHDLTGIQDVAEQVASLDAWMVQTAKEIVPA